MVFGRRSGHRIERVGLALISLAGVLLAVTLGAAPSSASSVVAGGHGTPAFSVRFMQPDPPTGLTARAVSGSEVDLSWTAPTQLVAFPVGLSSTAASGAAPAGYFVYDGITSNGESGTSVNSDPVTGTTFQVTGLTSGTTYYFEVTAVDAAGNEGDVSNEAQATTSGPGGGLTGNGSTGTSEQLGGALGGVAVIGAAIVGVLVWWRWRRRRKGPTSDTSTAPPPSIQAVPDAGPPAAISIHATGTGVTHTVRIEPHPGQSVTTIEKVPR